jgi:hypothetical protein
MSNPTRRACTSIDLPSLCESKVTTPAPPRTTTTIGSTVDPADPTSRLGFCLVISRRPEEAETSLAAYRGQHVGERSVGLRSDVAGDIAEMLRIAVSTWRVQHAK